MKDPSQFDLVRERFTRTAEQFGRFSLSTRNEEAGRLMELLLDGFPSAARRGGRGLDVACGPGTFTLALAARVGTVAGLDLTPALLERARAAAEREKLGNVTFYVGDANATPFRDGEFDLITCGYALHHIAEPARTVAEVARLLRRGGRLGLMDLIVPEDAVMAEENNLIERLRDASHTRTLKVSELRELAEGEGLRILREEVSERLRSFDEWMLIAGAGPGTKAYQATREYMEPLVELDGTGFRPRYATEADALRVPPIAKEPRVRAGDLLWTQTSVAIVGERA